LSDRLDTDGNQDRSRAGFGRAIHRPRFVEAARRRQFVSRVTQENGKLLTLIEQTIPAIGSTLKIADHQAEQTASLEGR
jgi:hypothetical protein